MVQCVVVAPMSQKSPAIFIADSAALNFLNSIATPVDTKIDWISEGERLFAWLQQAELVPADTLRALRKHVEPTELDRVAAQARNLGEWFRSFVYENSGKPLTAAALADLEPLNRL